MSWKDQGSETNQSGSPGKLQEPHPGHLTPTVCCTPQSTQSLRLLRGSFGALQSPLGAHGFGVPVPALLSLWASHSVSNTGRVASERGLVSCRALKKLAEKSKYFSPSFVFAANRSSASRPFQVPPPPPILPLISEPLGVCRAHQGQHALREGLVHGPRLRAHVSRALSVQQATRE